MNITRKRSHAAKQRIYAEFARISKVLAAPARLELLDLLIQGERSVDALATATELAIANASQHLQVLAAARLVDSRRDGQRVLYHIADDSVIVLWHALRCARYCLHRAADVAFPFEPLDDDEVIELGNTIVRVVHTPGHTPESVSLVVSDLRRGPEPWFVCTGDTLFVGAVGRPDLPGRERDNAGELHRSVHDKLLALPGEVEIYPGHFAGSACGAGMSGKPSSTIAFERRWNPLLACSAADFVDQVGGAALPRPAGMDAILSFNQGRDV